MTITSAKGGTRIIFTIQMVKKGCHKSVKMLNQKFNIC